MGGQTSQTFIPNIVGQNVALVWLGLKDQKSKLEPDWKAYRKLKNFFLNLIKQTKRNFFKNKLDENWYKPEKFWKTVNEVFPAKKSENFCNKSFIIGEKTVRALLKGSDVATTLKKASFSLENFAWRFNAFEPIIFRKICRF